MKRKKPVILIWWENKKRGKPVTDTVNKGWIERTCAEIVKKLEQK